MKIAFFILLSIFTDRTLSFEPDIKCDQFKKSSIVKIYELHFNEAENLKPLWGSFSFLDNLLFLTSSKY